MVHFVKKETSGIFLYASKTMVFGVSKNKTNSSQIETNLCAKKHLKIKVPK